MDYPFTHKALRICHVHQWQVHFADVQGLVFPSRKHAAFALPPIHTAMKRWCRDNCSGPFKVTFSDRISFQNEADAMMCYLRWI